MKEDKKNPKVELEDEKDIKEGRVSKRRYQSLLEEKEKLEKELQAWKDKYYRAFADTENLKKQYDQDHRLAIKYRAYGFVDRLIPVLDSFHVALTNEPTDPVLKNYLTGFQYIYRQFVEALENEGISEYAPKIGEAFNGEFMHALDTEVHEDYPPNTVVRVYAKGYKLHDRMVRAAMVIVSKLPEPVKQEETNVDEQNDGQSSTLA